MKKFYAVIASNGVGIYNDYGKYLCSSRYLRGNNSKGFGQYNDAYDYILNNGDFPEVCDIPDTFPLNRIIYFKNMQ